MVAAIAADRVLDVAAASELGSLLLCHRSIRDPRWRLDAVVRLVPVYLRLGIPLDVVRVEVRRGVRAAVCVPAWRERLEAFVLDSLERGCVASLVSAVAALWTRSEPRTAQRAHEACEALEDPYTLALQRPSLATLTRVVESVASREDLTRAERIAHLVRPRERTIAEAQLARSTLRVASAEAAFARVRGIRYRSVRAGAYLLLARAAHDIDTTRTAVKRIETKLLRQVGELELARRIFLQGAVRDALRALLRIDDTRLAAEVALLRAEIRLVAGRGWVLGFSIPARMHATSYMAPAWTHVEPPLATEAREDLVRAGVFSRHVACGGDPTFLDDATMLIAGHVHDATFRRRWLALAERARLPDALVHPALRAEHVGLRVERLMSQSLPAALSLGIARGTIATSDARSVERALFDEGVSLSAAASKRRRVLIGVARTCLRGAAAAPAAWPDDVVATRLRTLVHLGGSLASDAVAKTLATSSLPLPLSMRAFEALCMLDAERAARVALARAGELAASGLDLEAMLGCLELHGGVPSGLTRSYRLARTALARAFRPEHAARWACELLTALRARHDTLARVLEAVPAFTQIPRSAGALLAALDGIPQRLAELDHVAIATRLANEARLLDELLVARPPRVDPRMPAWSTERWREQLRKAVAYTTVDRGRISAFVRRCGRRHWYDALCRADLVALGVQPTTVFHAGSDHYRLRLLDKRLDLLTYLRFADLPTRTCFRSDHAIYDDTWLPTQEALIEVWKDPLSFCFHVERGRDDSDVPRGLWFGSFAVVDGQPAVVMNGVYMRPSTTAVLDEVVRAFERAVCEPLAITQIGLADTLAIDVAKHYVQRSVRLVRYRALGKDGKPIVLVYDDVSLSANEEITLDYMRWRR